MDNESKIEFLTEMGLRIYGNNWKSELARVFNINDRSVRQWANGERTIPDQLIRGMISHMYDRADSIIRVAESITRQIEDEPEYERIIWAKGYVDRITRSELDTMNRTWFDIDGVLYAIHPCGTIIDRSGNDAELPYGVTPEQLQDVIKNDIDADYAD